MSHGLTGAIVGVLASLSLGVAVPRIGVLRHFVAAALLSTAIIVAAWYLP